ncbi:hypothetical protein ACFQY8_06390 [Alloscardovia venturai]|uniref:ABC transporter permease n=1 Tax=Alloscardovia venturai TaxID=1769421 RepID=A0ABW2Y593_9BIFI
MRDILTVVKLRWALTLATARKSVWQAIGLVISLIFWIAAVVGMWFVFLNVNFASQTLRDIHDANVGYVIAAVWGIGTVFISIMQIAAFGQGGINARDLSRFGLSHATIRSALVISSMFQPSGIALFFMLWGATALSVTASVHSLVLIVGLWIVSAVTSVLAVGLSQFLSRTLSTLALTLFQSKKARTVIYVIFVIVVILLSQVGSLTTSHLSSQAEIMAGSHATDEQVDAMFDKLASQEQSFAWLQLVKIGRVLSWTPLASINVVSYDIAALSLISILTLVMRIVLWAVGMWLLALAFDWSMRREILQGKTQQSDQNVSKRGLGLFAMNFVHSPLTAIIARIGTSWQRDVRYGISLIMPILFAGIFTFQAMTSGIKEMLIMIIPLTAFFMCIMGLNMLSYDGPAFIMHTMAGVKGVTDWWARSIVQLTIGAVFEIIVSVYAFFVGNMASQMQIFTIAVIFSLAMLLSGIGISAVLSSLVMYPVPSADQPMKNPQGRTAAQVFVPLAWILALLVTFAPAGTAAGIIAVQTENVTFAVCIAAGVQVVISMIVFIAGNILGGALTDTRRLTIQKNLRKFAQLNR